VPAAPAAPSQSPASALPSCPTLHPAPCTLHPAAPARRCGTVALAVRTPIGEPATSECSRPWGRLVSPRGSRQRRQRVGSLVAAEHMPRAEAPSPSLCRMRTPPFFCQELCTILAMFPSALHRPCTALSVPTQRHWISKVQGWAKAGTVLMAAA